MPIGYAYVRLCVYGFVGRWIMYGLLRELEMFFFVSCYFSFLSRFSSDRDVAENKRYGGGKRK